MLIAAAAAEEEGEKDDCVRTGLYLDNYNNRCILPVTCLRGAAI